MEKRQLHRSQASKPGVTPPPFGICFSLVNILDKSPPPNFNLLPTPMPMNRNFRYAYTTNLRPACIVVSRQVEALKG